jgi:hypothetical protein
MAQFKDRQHVTHSNDHVFETRHAPGTKPRNPGIYRCMACGEEIVVGAGEALPAEAHEAKWQLLVRAEPIQKK